MFGSLKSKYGRAVKDTGDFIADLVRRSASCLVRLARPVAPWLPSDRRRAHRNPVMTRRAHAALRVVHSRDPLDGCRWPLANQRRSVWDTPKVAKASEDGQ